MLIDVEMGQTSFPPVAQCSTCRYRAFDMRCRERADTDICAGWGCFTVSPGSEQGGFPGGFKSPLLTGRDTPTPEPLILEEPVKSLQRSRLLAFVERDLLD